MTATDGLAEQTLLDHVQAFGSGDVDAIMADYHENAVFITPDSVLRRSAEIRTFFEGLVADFEISQQLIEGDLACVVWSGESEKLKIPFATDTLIVRDGKISAQTFAAQMEAKT